MESQLSIEETLLYFMEAAQPYLPQWVVSWGPKPHVLGPVMPGLSQVQPNQDSGRPHWGLANPCQAQPCHALPR